MLTPINASADCDWAKGLACYSVFASCGLTAGFAGTDRFIECVDTLSNHWCTECITNRGLDPHTVPSLQQQPLSVPTCSWGRSVGANQDGRLEVFAIDRNGVPFHIWQSTPSGDWVANAVAFPPLTRSDSFAAVITRPDGLLDVFVVGQDKVIRHIRQLAPNSNWGQWESLGNGFASGIAPGANADGGTLVAAVKLDHATHYATENGPGGLRNWTYLGESFVGTPTIGRNADGRLEIFAVGTNGELFHAWQVAVNGGWSGWASFGGNFRGTPVATRNADGRLEVFVTTSTGALAHAWQITLSGSWSNLATFPGFHKFDFSVGTNVDGSLEAFVVGIADSNVWHTRQSGPNGGWSDWYSLDGIVQSAPQVGRSADGRLNVFAIGQGFAIWHKNQTSPNSNTWTEWKRLGGVALPSLF